MRSASFRFYGPLNDFLPAAYRQTTVICTFQGSASVKDVVEALGIPHPEIYLLLANGSPVDFSYIVREGDRVTAYPTFFALDVADLTRVAPPPQHEPRFIADVHLGRLAAYLRLAGADTAYDRDYADRQLVEISVNEDRTLLTRDVGVLKHRKVVRGYFVRETQPARQFVEVLRRFDLTVTTPFSRCLRCNSELSRVAMENIADLLEPKTRKHYTEFSQCPTCTRVYWQGSHYDRLKRFLYAARAAATGHPGTDVVH